MCRPESLRGLPRQARSKTRTQRIWNPREFKDFSLGVVRGWLHQQSDLICLESGHRTGTQRRMKRAVQAVVKPMPIRFLMWQWLRTLERIIGVLKFIVILQNVGWAYFGGELDVLLTELTSM